MEQKTPNAIKGITVFRSYADAILNPAYTLEEQAKLWEAVFRYAFYDEEIELTGTAASLFALILPNLANSKKQALNAMHRHKANPKPDESRTQAKCEPERAKCETAPSLILNSTPTPIPDKYPENIEKVLEIARGSGLKWTKDDAELYYLNRVRQGWYTATGQQITDVKADIMLWGLKQSSKNCDVVKCTSPDKEAEAALRAKEREAFFG